jgi:hypothetical protein
MLELAAERYFFTPCQTLKTVAYSRSGGIDPDEISRDGKRLAIQRRS